MIEHMKEVDETTLYRDRNDEWLWRDNETQVYTIKSIYGNLKIENTIHDGFLYEVFWKTKTLSLAQYFSWHA